MRLAPHQFLRIVERLVGRPSFIGIDKFIFPLSNKFTVVTEFYSTLFCHWFLRLKSLIHRKILVLVDSVVVVKMLGKHVIPAWFWRESIVVAPAGCPITTFGHDMIIAMIAHRLKPQTPLELRKLLLGGELYVNR